MSGTERPAHVPVLLERCVGLLAPALTRPEDVVVDCTLGMGGHAEALLASTPARLVGLDRDPEALRRSGERLAPFGARVTLVHAVYDALPEVLADLGLQRVQGILFDLGVSSLQLDEAARGFAYAQDAPLDMRMDPTTGRSAAEVVNTYDGKALAEAPQGVRRRAVRLPDRRRDRPRARRRALHPHGSAGRAGARGHPGRHPPHRWPPGQAHLPGAPHRGQRRARRAAPRGAGRPRRARRRRPHRRHELPVARGQDREVGADRPLHQRRAARPAVRARGLAAGAAAAGPRLREGHARPRSTPTRAPSRSASAPRSGSSSARTRHDHRRRPHVGAAAARTGCRSPPPARPRRSSWSPPPGPRQRRRRSSSWWSPCWSVGCSVCCCSTWSWPRAASSCTSSPSRARPSTCASRSWPAASRRCRRPGVLAQRATVARDGARRTARLPGAAERQGPRSADSRCRTRGREPTPATTTTTAKPMTTATKPSTKPAATKPAAKPSVQPTAKPAGTTRTTQP